MSNSSRWLSRGDRRRNDTLERLRGVITRETAVLAFDLAADKQVCALTDQDSRVLARRTVKAKAWQLAEAVEWGLAQAAAAGFCSVVVACEPTGHRWRVLDQIAEQAGVRLVCVQPLLVHRAQESEDFPHNKSDETDAMIIARLVTELRCYLPERADPTWARLRHLGARRIALVTDATAAKQQITDLLECAWPAALQAAGKPMKSKSWLAAMTVALDRVGPSGDLSVIRRWGWTRFAAAVRRELPRHGATRWYPKIVRAVFDAAADPARAAAGVADQRAGALERIRFALADLAPRPRRDHPGRGPHGRGVRRAGPDHFGDQHPRALRCRRRRHPRRHRRPHPVHKRPGAGQARRDLPPRQRLRHLPGQDRNQRPRPPPTPPRSLASGVGRVAQQPGARSPVRAPDRPSRQQAHRRPGAGRGRRQPAASAPCRHHHRQPLGPRHRRRTQPAIPSKREGGRRCRMTPRRRS
jgi:transposase